MVSEMADTETQISNGQVEHQTLPNWTFEDVTMLLQHVAYHQGTDLKATIK